MKSPLKLKLKAGLRSLLILSLIGVIILSGATAAIADAPQFTIDQARQQSDGVEVTITGVVTVPSGWFRSANLDQGFVIQDATGGLYITTPQGLPLSLGESVEVSGVLGDDGHGQRWVKLKECQRRGSALSTVVPKPVSAQVAGQQMDGQLVTVRGKIVRSLQDDAPYGDRLWIEDDTGEIQIYMPKSTAIYPQNLPFLQLGRKIQVTGLSSQFDDNDEVIPRRRADIQLVDGIRR